jgi:chemotaxis protein CheZ
VRSTPSTWRSPAGRPGPHRQGAHPRWDAWFANPIELDHARQLVLDTRGYLGEVPQKASAINSQLMEILMAQDFQDLTGQVIKKMMEVVNDVETQLLQVLIDNSPHREASEKRRKRHEHRAAAERPAGRRRQPDAVTDQAQVDDLLESLGF